MNVTEAVTTRRSVRQFLDTPVPQEVLNRVLTKAQASPSGGNTQPWNAVILTGQPLADLTTKIKARAATAPLGEAPEYAIYPKELEGRYEVQGCFCISQSIQRGDGPGSNVSRIWPPLEQRFWLGSQV